MKRLGLTLIAVSFLAGAYIAVLHPTEINWTWFVPVVVVGFVGVFLARRADKARDEHADTLKANVAQLEQSIARIVEQVSRLDAEKDDTHVYDFPKLIDDQILEHLNRFVDVRDTMKSAYGLKLFAEVMGPYAGGERYLNRVWAASADGYVDEAHEYVGRALEQFLIAQEKLLAAR